MTLPAGSRRSFVLVTVLVVAASALLVATGLLFVAQSDAAGRAQAGEEAQTRAMAASALRVLGVRLDAQRDRILEGLVPLVDDEIVLWETDTELALARLRPLGPGGATLVPEAGRLDLNSVDAARLVATGLASPDAAAAIVAARDARPGRRFASVADLLAVPGVAPEDVYGPLDRLGADGTGGAASPGAEDDLPRGLADVVTVWAVAPAIQRDGVLRVNLDVPWSEELGERLDDRFGRGAGAIVRQMMDSGLRFDDDRVIARTVLPRGLELTRDVLDALTTDPDGLHFGRLDLNTASPEALATLPGFDPDIAASIVNARGTLAPGERWSVMWPAFEGILEADAYAELAGLVTTRCWTYRARIAVGTVDPDEADGPLRRPFVVEVVMDLSAPAARVAYLRDVTLLRTAALLAADASEQEIPDEAGFEDEASTGDPGATASVTPDGRADDDPFDELFEDPFGDPFGDPFDDPFDDPIDGPTGGVADDAVPVVGPAGSPAPAGRPRTRIGRWLPPR